MGGLFVLPQGSAYSAIGEMLVSTGVLPLHLYRQNNPSAYPSPAVAPASVLAVKVDEGASQRVRGSMSKSMSQHSGHAQACPDPFGVPGSASLIGEAGTRERAG